MRTKSSVWYFRMAKEGCKHFNFFALLLTFSTAAFAATEFKNGELVFKISSDQPKDGGLMILEAEVPKGSASQSLSAKFEEVEIPFFQIDTGSSEKKPRFVALFAVPYNHKPGPVKLVLQAGKNQVEAPFEIVDGGYKSETLKVDKKYDNLSKKDLARYRRDQAEVGAAYGLITPKKLWDGKFILPINSPVTSVYGSKRMFNGQLKSSHQGTDLKASVGTPIVAPGGGKVVLAKDLLFSGNTVILEHGLGLFTVYMHLSKFKVKVGQEVKSGDLLGLSGKTGRVTGPHLHWGAVIHRAKIDPLDLMKMTL